VEMMQKKGLQEDDIQKIHTTAPEQLTDQELLLITISGTDLARKHSGKEIYNHYKEKKQTEQQATGAALKRVMSERERESEVIEIDNDITTPDVCAQEPLRLCFQALSVSDGMKDGTPAIL
jgi:hypothetical protein